MVDVLQNWLNWFHFLFLEGGLLVILIDCMIFLSPFLDVTRMSMSTVSFLPQLELWNPLEFSRLWNSLPIEYYFPLIYDLNGFKYRINRHLLTVFLNRFLVSCNLYIHNTYTKYILYTIYIDTLHTSFFLSNMELYMNYNILPFHASKISM